MKYQLLWAACFVGLLQLSAVASRSTVDEEIINKENAKYSTTTVGPTVAYTGQEVERGVNSSGKLAVDPGVASSDAYQYQFNWSLYVLIVFVCCVLVFLIYGCIAIYYRHKRVRPGVILNSHSQQLQSSAVKLHQPTNELPLAYVCQNCQQQPELPVPGHQCQNIPLQKNPPSVHAVYQVAPVQQQTAGYSISSAQRQKEPTETEFENPLSSLGLAEEPQSAEH